MGILRRTENFIRSESWLHLTTMYLLISLIIKGFDKIDISLYLWVLFLIPILFAFGWEIYWKYKRGNIIDKMDIFYTILGGYLAILTLRF